MHSFYSFYSIELLCFLIFNILFISFSLRSHIKENKSRLSRGLVEKNGSMAMILILLMLSMIILSSFYATYEIKKCKITNLIEIEQIATELRVKLRKKDRLEFTLLNSEFKSKKNRYSFGDYVIDKDMSKNEYLIAKDLVSNCFSRDVSPDVYELFDYYPVSNLEAKEKIVDSLIKENTWVSKDSCGTILSSSLIFIK